MSLSNFIELAQYYPFLLKGVGWTLLISAIAIIGGSVIGLGVALMRVSPYAILRTIGVIYVDFFRTTPLIVQLVWFYYAFPILTRIRLTEIEAGCIAMTLFSAAYLAEVFRAGILSIEKGQNEAALALGMNPARAMIRIILPQAILRMTPAIANVFISKVKDSALVSTIGVPELLRQASVMGEFSALRMESLTIAAFLYFCITYPLSKGSDLLHRKFTNMDRPSGDAPALDPVGAQTLGKA
jgi:His/Glu/Gln/Arg/opine family amino acid ABC transporter permease subunit